MKFRIVIVPKAKKKLLDAALWWSQHVSSEQAADWLDGIELHFNSLVIDPNRHPIAREAGCVSA